MNDGRVTCLAILSLLLLAPLAHAATPQADRPSADGMDGQEITDLGVDATGQFAAVVVAYDNTKVSLLPGSTSHDDVYLCDYGPAERPSSGSGCRGLRHAGTVVPTTQAPNAPQRVAATLFGNQGWFAVAGPGQYVSLWQTTSDVPKWTSAMADAQPAQNITIAPDTSRVVVGTAPTSPTAGGRLVVLHGSNGTEAWKLNLQNAQQAAVRPTSLAYSRTGNVLAIGTSDGLLLADPTTTSAPQGSLGGLPQAESVNKVGLSGDGEYVAAAASNGVFLAKVKREGSKLTIDSNTVFARNLGEGVTDVAIALDGSRFAAAVGNKVHVWKRLNTTALAEPLGEGYDVGARVADIDFDQSGKLLVAVAGSKVIGFGPNKMAPIWQFDASQNAYGGVDGPLRRVSVSDDAQRILVAGRTESMAYSSVIGVSASLGMAGGGSSIAPTQTRALTLTVKNTGSLADNYSFVVSTPIGWPSASADPIRLDPEEVGTVTFNVTAPAGGEPGVYGVQARVRSEAAEKLAERRNQPSQYVAGPAFNLTIPRSVVLKVEAPDERIVLSQGSERTVPVTIRNEGNAEGVVNLSIRQELTRGASWDIRFEGGDQIRVPAASSTNINMIILGPSDAGSGDRNVITIRAREGETVEATDQVTAYIDAQFGAEMRTNQSTWEFYPGQVQTIRVNVTNIGNTEDVYNLTHTVSPAAVQSDWRVTIETPQITIDRGQTKVVAVTVKAVASDAREATLTLRTISQNSPDKQENSLVLNLLTIPRPPTDDDQDRLLPGPSPLAVLAAVGLLALGRRLAGGRR